jgi:hypothetical protein
MTQIEYPQDGAVASPTTTIKVTSGLRRRFLYICLVPLDVYTCYRKKSFGRARLAFHELFTFTRQKSDKSFLFRFSEEISEGDYVLKVFLHRFSILPLCHSILKIRKSASNLWYQRFSGFIEKPIEQVRRTYSSVSPNLMEPVKYLNIIENKALEPKLNVMLPRLAMSSVSGGPNTAFNISYRVAATGIPVRYISVNASADQDCSPLHEHIRKISGVSQLLENVEFVDAHDENISLEFSDRDVYFATAWWTAYSAKQLFARTGAKGLIYLIQEFEPGLHQYSMAYALALATYSMDYLPVVNHPFVYDFLCRNKIGSFSDPKFSQKALVFDPAVDRNRFFPTGQNGKTSRKLLFYARPDIGPRNLFEMGVIALQLAQLQGVFDDADWDVAGIGDVFKPISLSDELTLRSIDQYAVNWAKEIQSADILLSMIISPHPSYPPLEMLACGGIVVANTFDCKTASKLRSISENIIPVEPSVESIAQGLGQAVTRVKENSQKRDTLNAPKTWDDSLASIIPPLIDFWQVSSR